jgi:hypothetical protein
MTTWLLEPLFRQQLFPKDEGQLNRTSSFRCSPLPDIHLSTPGPAKTQNLPRWLWILREAGRGGIGGASKKAEEARNSKFARLGRSSSTTKLYPPFHHSNISTQWPRTTRPIRRHYDNLFLAPTSSSIAVQSGDIHTSEPGHDHT